MNILVTGGVGFIGSYLVERLIKDGHSVVILDDLSNGKKERVNKDAKFVLGDVRKKEDVNKAIEEIGSCDVIFHLAARPDVQSSIIDPETDYSISVDGTKNIVDVCENNRARLIFTSSAAVYGDVRPERLPIREDEKKNPISPYGKNKLRAENTCKGLHDFFIARPFNVYGPKGIGVVNKFCMLIKQGKELPMFNDGTNTRDYVHVNDVVDALLLGLKYNGIYNIGSGKETSLNEIIEIISRLAKKNVRKKFLPPVNEIKRSVADITKIKKIGWKPKISLENGIKSILDSL